MSREEAEKVTYKVNIPPFTKKEITAKELDEILETTVLVDTLCDDSKSFEQKNEVAIEQLQQYLVKVLELENVNSKQEVEQKLTGLYKQYLTEYQNYTISFFGMKKTFRIKGDTIRILNRTKFNVIVSLVLILIEMCLDSRYTESMIGINQFWALYLSIYLFIINIKLMMTAIENSKSGD